MSTTVAYDPDEFDNNPFAEPVIPTPATQQPEQQEQSPQEVSSANDSTQHEEPAEEHQEGREEPPSSSAEDQLIPERHESAQDFKIVVKVHALERSGTLTNKKENPGVIFDLSTNLVRFRKKVYKNVKKSYSEFETFFKFLNGANSECFVPSIPLPSTNFGIQNEDDYRKTIYNFQIWFQRVTANPILIRNDEFAYFVDSDFNTYSPVNKSRLPASGLKRKTLKQLQPPYDEALELAEFRPLIKSIYQNSKTIAEKLEKLSRLRKAFGISENELGAKIVELNELERNHPGMSNMWKKFGKTITNIGDLDSIIATLDLATVGDGLTSIINDGYVIKESLTNRHLLMRELINAQANTKVKHENARKLRNKRDINPIKVDLAIKELQDATDEEDALSKKIKRITEEMLIEKQEYLSYLDKLIKQILTDFTLRKIEYERRKLLVLERIRLDVRLVDSNGGLARLGRESYPKKEFQHSTSQGLKGDDWNGDRKSSHFTNSLLKVPKLDDDEEEISNEEQAEPEVQAQQEEEDSPINPREAASILGGSTF